MYKKLYRSEEDKMIGGVCGGLGEYFEIDPTLIRLLFALIFFGYGAGLMLYIFLWIIMPTEKMLQARKKRSQNDSSNADLADDVVEKEE